MKFKDIIQSILEGEYLIPLIKRIKEAGRILSPREQGYYNEIKKEYHDAYWCEGVF